MIITLNFVISKILYKFASKFKAKNYIIDQVIDWYGTEANIKVINDEECMITVSVNKEAFFCWAMQYGLHIEVTEPLDIRNRIKKGLEEIIQKYKD